MSCTGRIIGGIIGAFAGGPIGFGIGVWLGSFVDDSIIKERHKNNQKQAQDYMIGLLAKVAKADGVISKEEIRIVNHIFTESLDLQGAALEEARQTFMYYKDSNVSHKELAHNLRMLIHNPAVLEYIISALFLLPYTNGDLKDTEEKIIIEIAVTLGLSQDDYINIRRNYFHENYKDANQQQHHQYRQAHHDQEAEISFEQACTTLNSSPNDTFETLKQNYRKLVHKYHPDKLAKDLPPDLVTLSTNKFRQIQEAYEVVKKHYSQK